MTRARALTERAAKRSAAAQTAFGPMVIAAVERYTPAPHRVLDDDLAVRLLPPAQRLIVRACRWRAMRPLLIKATDGQAPGLWTGMICRKRYADDEVAEAVAAGIGQVVFLGAGLDTRGCRLVAPAGAHAFELDLPANIEYKTRRLRAVFGEIPERVSVIPVDFEAPDLGTVLATALSDSGFDATRPTLFVWEAVTQYLTEDAVRAIFAFLAAAAPGSRLIFTYVRKDFLDGTNLYDAPRLHQRMIGKYGVWHFGLAPDAVGALLGKYGWAEREQVGAAEYVQRYLVPAGRPPAVTEIERFVAAEKTDAEKT